MYPIKKLGKNIRKLRELRNFTQQYMAEKLDMTQGNYARIENDEIQLSEERLQRIAMLLDYSAEFIRRFDVEKIHDMVDADRVQPSKDLCQLHISAELKQLYEARIQSLEKDLEELRDENKRLKAIAFAKMEADLLPPKAVDSEPGVPEP
ncbi:MAG: helix-turn-helix transcriptional regulator [Edaphocola sp.]